LSWFQLVNLSYAPTSRYRKDTGTIIISVIGVVRAGDKVHISRKHTTARSVRQAIMNKITIKDSFTTEPTESTEKNKFFSMCSVFSVVKNLQS